MEPSTRLNVGGDGVALVLLDYKPLNALHPQRGCLRAVLADKVVIDNAA
jgi:hypothetical protein